MCEARRQRIAGMGPARAKICAGAARRSPTKTSHPILDGAPPLPATSGGPMYVGEELIQEVGFTIKVNFSTLNDKAFFSVLAAVLIRCCRWQKGLTASPRARLSVQSLRVKANLA